MGREGRDYWEEQLSEYWDSGLTIRKRPASSMVMVDRGEIFSKRKIATK